MIKYRPHKSTLDEAMELCQTFNTLEDMIQYVQNQWTGYIIRVSEEEYTDDRINWNNWHYVLAYDSAGKHYVAGMCNIEEDK